MRMTAADQAKYPKFTKYVRNSMPLVTKVKKIVKNMGIYANLTEEEFIATMVWGADPLVLIQDLTSSCGGSPANGCFDPNRTNEIIIDKERVDDFEAGSKKAFDKNARGQNVYIVGTTILHELCHWGYNRALMSEPEEVGIAFEVATYGRNTG